MRCTDLREENILMRPLDMSFFQGYETDEPCQCFFKANSNPRVYRTADIVLPTEFLCTVICDFGEARPLGSPVHYNEPPFQLIPYCAPEVILSGIRACSYSLDIWNVGMMVCYFSISA